MGANRSIDAFFRPLEIVMVVCMVVMLVMVFGNVVLRLFFNTGIDLSEEVPRFAFVWMTFLGGIVGLHRRRHLGVDMVVHALPVFGRKVCWGISQAIMLVCSLFIFYGTWLQHDIIAGTRRPSARSARLGLRRQLPHRRRHRDHLHRQPNPSGAGPGRGGRTDRGARGGTRAKASRLSGR